jgi:DNA-binding response OmpR family regulator
MEAIRVPAGGCLAGYRVLVVEDHADSRALLRIVLETYGARVSDAATATDALRLVETDRPHLVVTDIALPDRDGVWLLEQVRSATARASARVVAVTGYRDRREELVRRGFDLVFIKPLEPFEVSGRLAALLNGVQC